MPLSPQQKLQVLFRLEPGCLGPDGLHHIEAFCQFAQPQTEQVHGNVVSWQLVPRYDKSLAEIQCYLANRLLAQTQADKYLAMFALSTEQIELDLNDWLSQKIDQFFER